MRYLLRREWPTRRGFRFWWQRRTRGWDDSVTWNLDQQLAQWLAPRLERFREINNGFPHDMSQEEWDAELADMAWSAKWYAEHAYDFDGKADDYDRAVGGLRKVTERLRDLWW